MRPWDLDIHMKMCLWVVVVPLEVALARMDLPALQKRRLPLDNHKHLEAYGRGLLVERRHSLLLCSMEVVEGMLHHGLAREDV